MANSGKPRRRKLVRRIILIVLLLALAGGVGWYAYNALKREYTTTYDTYTATTGSISNALSFSGNLSLIDSASYTAASSGTVKTVYAPAGTAVKEGDRLLRLANGETVTADFDGRVNVLNFAEGDSVAAGDTLVQIADFTHLRVTFRVDEYDISDVAVGQACTVTVTSLEKAYESSIAAIDYISASTGNVAYYTATAYVDVDGDALPGMQVTVTIPQEEAKDVVILKVDALSFDGTNQAFVWMKGASGELEQVNVTTGVSNGNYIEITSGLSDGDQVYVEAKAEETNTGGLLSGLFGGQQFNQPAGGPGGNMPGGGNMPDRGNWSGERGERGSGGTRSNGGGGNP
jgi:HlyD family secretion protein